MYLTCCSPVVEDSFLAPSGLRLDFEPACCLSADLSDLAVVALTNQSAVAPSQSLLAHRLAAAIRRALHLANPLENGYYLTAHRAYTQPRRSKAPLIPPRPPAPYSPLIAVLQTALSAKR